MTSPAELQNPTDPGSGAGPLAEPSFVVRVFASGFFTGYAPFAPGTAGSALALLLYFIPGFEHPIVIVTVCFFTFVVGIKVSDQMETHYGHDPRPVVIDEILGMWLSLLMHPKSLMLALTAFLLFRIMDIVKPFPARRLDRMRGGLAVMLDDVVAAIYTNLIVHFMMLSESVRQFLLTTPFSFFE
jgi:phosphatidylglycerophosphatase A